MRRSWWGKSPEPPADVAAALADLDRLGHDRPELEGPSRTLARVIAAMFVPPATEGPRDDSEADAHRVRVPTACLAGQPYYRMAPPVFEAAALARRGEAICESLRPDNPAAGPLRLAIRRGQADFNSWGHAVLAGAPEAVVEQARALRLDASLAASVLRLAMLPALSTGSAAIAECRPEGAWSWGDCPNCGSPPLLAELRGLERRRFLRCGLCAADWPTDRLRCPTCGEADPHAISSITVEGGESQARLARCASCEFRLKVVSTLGPLSAPGLLVTDLATIHLDLIAGEGPLRS